MAHIRSVASWLGAMAGYLGIAVSSTVRAAIAASVDLTELYARNLKLGQQLWSASLSEKNRRDGNSCDTRRKPAQIRSSTH